MLLFKKVLQLGFSGTPNRIFIFLKKVLLIKIYDLQRNLYKKSVHGGKGKVLDATDIFQSSS